MAVTDFLWSLIEKSMAWWLLVTLHALTRPSPPPVINT